MNALKKLKSNFLFHYRALRDISDGKWDFCVLAADYLYCRLRFGVTHYEYLNFGFYDFSDHYRKNFLLKKHRKKYHHIQTKFFTLSKYTFYRRIPDLYRREVLLAPHCGQERFLEFLKKHKTIIIKPDTGCVGRGVEKVEYTDDTAALEVFATFDKTSPTICEELIRQHEVLSRLHPYCVNTVRVLSLLQDDEVHILAATLKIGTDPGSLVENKKGKGLAADVDTQTGIVTSYGMDGHCNRIVHHPVSGVQIIGIQIPCWQEALTLVKEAHKRLPQCRFYGWDIAITEDGPDIVEANGTPADRASQAISRTPKGGKIIPLLKKNRLKQKNPKFEPNYDD